jgi:hypothetical protein
MPALEAALAYDAEKLLGALLLPSTWQMFWQVLQHLTQRSQKPFEHNHQEIT